jgi:hypothetical protein
LPGRTPEFQVDPGTFVLETRYVGDATWVAVPGGDLDDWGTAYRADAAASAAAALASQNAASASAGTATTQAGIATTKAGEASTSADTATTQAGVSTTKAGESATSATLSKDWATKLTTEVTAGQGYSAREHAIGTAVPTGSAKDWATKTASEVAVGQGYGAKKYANDAAASAAAAATFDPALYLSKAGNLAGLASLATAQGNLGISTFGATLIDDTTAAAARATIGLKWTPIDTIIVTGTNIAEANITIPTTVSMVRVSGCVFASSAVSGQLLARVSLDNGATYPFGPTDYNFGNLINVNTVVSAAGNASATALYLSGSHVIAGSLPVFVEALFSVGAGNQTAFHSKSSAFNFGGASGYVNSFYNGYYTVSGRATNLKFLFSGGQLFASGTRLVIEGL